MANIPNQSASIFFRPTVEPPHRREAIFSKILTGTDINRLAMPTALISHFGQITKGNHTIDFEALDIEGSSWVFRLSTQKEGHPKPVLNGNGWYEFVRAKNLKEGDIITFFKEINKDNAMTFKIEAQKKILLSDEDITAVV